MGEGQRRTWGLPSTASVPFFAIQLHVEDGL